MKLIPILYGESPFNPAGLSPVTIYPWEDPIAFFMHLDWILQAIIIAIVLLAALSAVLLVAVPVAVNRHRRERKRQHATGNRIIGKIGALIALRMEPGERKPETKALEQQITDELSRDRLYLRKHLMHLALTSGATTLPQLRELYGEFGLEEALTRDLKSGNPARMAKAAREIAVMHLRKNRRWVEQLVFHRHPAVAGEALAAVAALWPEDLPDFLPRRAKLLSDWEQILLLEALDDLAPGNRPDLVRLFDSEHPRLRILAIRFVEYFRQVSALDHVREAATEEDLAVATAAIHCLVKLNDCFAVARLREIYPDRPVYLQVKILWAIGAMGGPRDAEFLRSRLEDPEPRIRRAALVACLKSDWLRRSDLLAKVLRAHKDGEFTYPLVWFKSA